MVFGPYLKYIFPLSIQMRKNEGRHKKSLYHDGDTREERGPQFLALSCCVMGLDFDGATLWPFILRSQA